MTVSFSIPTGATGASLARVEFNGTAYANGSTLPLLTAGYGYTFSVVNLTTGYSFEKWEVTNGTISHGNMTTTSIYFPCYGSPCTPIILGVGLHSGGAFSGVVYTTRNVWSMSATFTVPAVSWWKLNSSPAPSPGATELVDWGVGLGGVSNSSALVVGLNITYESKGGGNFYPPFFQPFWSTAIQASSAQTSFSHPGSIQSGNTIAVDVTTLRCPNSLVVQSVNFSFSDLTVHWSVYHLSTGYSCSGSFTPTTGEWLVWNPRNASGSFSSSYQNGVFSNLTLNGLPVYGYNPYYVLAPPWCRSWPTCVLLFPAGVSYTQWLNAHNGWNESLNPGNVAVCGGSPTNFCFHPYVSTLAHLNFAIYPYDPFNASDPLEILANGTGYPNGASANLPVSASTPLGMVGAWSNSTSGESAAFALWGTNTGSLLNASRQNTSLYVTQPGTLEALTLENVSALGAGYTEAPPVPSLSTFSVAGEFQIPTSTYNQSFTVNGVHKDEVVSFWVGMGGAHPVAGAYVSARVGISIVSYANTGVVKFDPPWFLFQQANGYAFDHPTWNFTMKAGDWLNLSVAYSTFTSAYSWSVTDLNQSPPPGQPPGRYENWNGTLATTVVDTSTAEWVVQGATPMAQGPPRYGPWSGPMPSFASVSFSKLWVNAGVVDLFGAFQAAMGSATWYGIPQHLTSVLLASPGAAGFSVREA